MSTEPIHTAFDAPQRALGCEFMDWEGWFWPSHFGDPLAEHRAVREGVGVWDESPLRKWDFRGPDALRAADRIFTNDMFGLEVGQIRYAPFCDADGKMVGDGTVFNFGGDHAWVITALDSDLDHFREVVSADASTFSKPRVAGPCSTSPHDENRDPWAGQSQVFSTSFQATIPPRCGHTAEHSCSPPPSSR